MSSSPWSHRRVVAKAVAGASVLVLLAGCGTDDGGAAPSSAAAPATSTEASATAAAQVVSTSLFDSSVVHTIAIDYDDADYQAMIATFLDSGDKNWISATVTIDGTVFSNVGIKLKGNSTLKGLSDATGGGNGAGAGAGAGGGGMGGDLSVDDPAGLPWRIRLDKYVDGQNYGGETDFVVRGGNTETGLNEAVALELIGAAGLATEQATSTRLSVNGSAQTLRLVIENPTDDWDDENFQTDGILYKAEAGGDYSYRGEDAASYADVFSVEASTSGDDDYTPLISFLQFINDSDDATFAAELSQHLDVDAFAKYLAVQELVANSDDIDGPGNNSYLRYDSTTGAFTVVAWDQNSSFSIMGGGGGGGGQRPAGGAGAQAPAAAGGAQVPAAAGGAQVPAAGTAAADGASAAPADAGAAAAAAPPAGGGRGGGMGGGGMSGNNILTKRFLANTNFKALYDSALATLKTDLYASGTAQQILDTWTSVFTAQASDLVSTDTITSEAAAISKYFTAS